MIFTISIGDFRATCVIRMEQTVCKKAILFVT